MTEQEWLTSTDPTLMLKFLGDNPGNESGNEPLLNDVLSRKLRLFACACCRRIWPLLATVRSRRAVEVAERFADNQAGSLALLIACLATILHWPHAPGHIPGYGASQIFPLRAIPSGHASGCAWHCAKAIAHIAPGDPDASHKAESIAQASLVRDIFGNPFRSFALDPAWRTFVLTSLARSIYDQRDVPRGTLGTARLCLLADYLEEAGCHDAEILNHCRSEWPHVRGCWVVDLILCKQ